MKDWFLGMAEETCLENNLVLEKEALKGHLEAYISQLFGKEEIHSIDKKTIMGTDYARLSLKT